MSLTMNQLNVIWNKAQTKTKKVLCLCSAGVLRSPTAANVIHDLFGFNTRSAGLVDSFALIPVTESLLIWADEIVVMEQQQVDEIETKLKNVDMDLDFKRVLCLNIPDQFYWNDDELKNLIHSAYSNYMDGSDINETFSEHSDSE
jgi:predicted protein tyrosine phosphatase